MSLTVPRASTSRRKVATAVLIWKIPAATAWDGDWFRRAAGWGPPWISWKLMADSFTRRWTEQSEREGNKCWWLRQKGYKLWVWVSIGEEGTLTNWVVAAQIGMRSTHPSLIDHCHWVIDRREKKAIKERKKWGMFCLWQRWWHVIKWLVSRCSAAGTRKLLLLLLALLLRATCSFEWNVSVALTSSVRPWIILYHKCVSIW